jgi:hypothetical protein
VHARAEVAPAPPPHGMRWRSCMTTGFARTLENITTGNVMYTAQHGPSAHGNSRTCALCTASPPRPHLSKRHRAPCDRPSLISCSVAAAYLRPAPAQFKTTPLVPCMSLRAHKSKTARPSEVQQPAPTSFGGAHHQWRKHTSAAPSACLLRPRPRRPPARPLALQPLPSYPRRAARGLLLGEPCSLPSSLLQKRLRVGVRSRPHLHLAATVAREARPGALALSAAARAW